MNTKRITHIMRWCANIILGFGTLLIFNEGDSFTPNLIALGCAALLIFINRNT